MGARYAALRGGNGPRLAASSTMPRRLAACCIAAVALAGVVPAAAHAQDGPSQAGGPLVAVAAPDADAWVRLPRAGRGAARPGALDEALSPPPAAVPAAGLHPA